MKPIPANGRPAAWCASASNGKGNGADLAARLTPDEKSALEELDRCVIQCRSHAPEAERLLSLGLAELNCGSLALTIAGRHALMALRAR